MKLEIVADESVNFNIVRALRKHGIPVISIWEECPSVPDSEVLDFANKHQAILLTEDSDFGEWVFAHHYKTNGVIFLRYTIEDFSQIVDALIKTIQAKQKDLEKKFIVITKNKIRIRNI